MADATPASGEGYAGTEPSTAPGAGYTGVERQAPGHGYASTERSTASGAGYTGVERSRATGWVAWVLFGGLLLGLLGCLHLTFGLVALLRPQILAAGRSGLALPLPVTALAALHLVLGAAAAVAGYGLFRGLGWARIASIGLCGLVALANFVFVAAYPAWSTVAIVLAGVIAYAVAAHGGEVAEAYGS